MFSLGRFGVHRLVNTAPRQISAFNTTSIAKFSTTIPRLNALETLSENAEAVSRNRYPKSKKVEHKLVQWKLYASFPRHNTICSLVAVVEDPDFLKNNAHLTHNEKVMYYLNLPHQVKLHVSAGQLGFRKSQRQDYEAGFQVAARLFKLIEERKLVGPNDKIELITKDFGKGKDAFLNALQGKEGVRIKDHIFRVTDRTPLKFGGSRSKKLRRL